MCATGSGIDDHCRNAKFLGGFSRRKQSYYQLFYQRVSQRFSAGQERLVLVLVLGVFQMVGGFTFSGTMRLTKANQSSGSSME